MNVNPDHIANRIHSDLVSTTDAEELGSWDLCEAPGQTRMEGV